MLAHAPKRHDRAPFRHTDRRFRCPDEKRVRDTQAFERARSLGADEVIDYAQMDFTRNGKKYDVIIDIVGKSSYSRCLKSMNRKGRYVLGNPTLTGMLRGLFTSLTSDKKVMSKFASYQPESFDFIRKLIEERKLRVVIDKRFTLEEVREAHRYVEAGLKAGNVIILVDHQ